MSGSPYEVENALHSKRIGRIDREVDVWSEIERLRSLLRKAMPGASMVEIAPGEVIGLYQRPDEA